MRRLAEARRDLPTELDLENVAEEIEDVGKSELSKVESFIRLTFRSQPPFSLDELTAPQFEI